MNPYKKCLSYGVDQTSFSSNKNLSKCREMQIFKFKQEEISDDYNNDDKNKATKGTKIYTICSVIKHGLQAEGQLPSFFDSGGGGGGSKRNRAERSITSVIFMSSASGAQFNYWDQIVEAQAEGSGTLLTLLTLWYINLS